MRNTRVRLFLGAMILLMPASLSFSSGKSKEKEKEKDKNSAVSLVGAIEDSQCAYNVHSGGRSHDWMIKNGVPGASDDKSCTLHCVKDMGGNFVLVVKDEVYRLDDQNYAERFAGAKVKITGTVDPKTHTIHILTIEDAH
jgi:hypothetical protein